MDFYFTPACRNTLPTVFLWQPTLSAIALWVRLASLKVSIFSRLLRVIRLVSIFAPKFNGSYLDFNLFEQKRTKKNFLAHLNQYSLRPLL
ncbi:hypothetical protein VCRA217O17_120174 [Vibrio crassostreae]|nr:hypothetical protein VCRA217O17_120174 [Vibrio crassostreae]